MDFANNSNINIYNCYFQTIEQNQRTQLEHIDEKIEMEQIYIPEPINKAKANSNMQLTTTLTQTNLLALTYPNYNQTNNSDYMEDVKSICSDIDMNTMVDQELVMDQLGDLFEMCKPFAEIPNNEEQMTDYIDYNDYNDYNYNQHTSCIGCIENQPNQLAHMGPFGCLVNI